MRVLLSPPHLGGTGGLERAVHDMTTALVSHGHRVDIWAPKELPGTWSVDAGLYRRVEPWRTRGSDRAGNDPRSHIIRALAPIRRAISPHYDVHIGFRWTRNINALVRADQHWVNPSGLLFGAEDLRSYDAVAMQAPDNASLLPNGSNARTVLLPPPLLPLSSAAEKVPGLPSEYVLTVFNAIHSIKGAADIGALLNASPLPVVWCTAAHASTDGVDDDVLRDPRLIIVREPTRAQLRWMYEHAYAYVSLSRTEGFGWAIADALGYTPRVVARRVGVLTFDEALQSGVQLLDSERGVEAIDWGSVAAAAADPADRDLSWLSDESFCRRIETLLA